MDRPVRIAGGGVSGLTAALLLARSGRPVEVHDRGQGAGRFAGGWQVLENGTAELDAVAELGALGLTGAPLRPVHRAVLLDGLGGVHEVASAAPFAYFLLRGGPGSLDAWLRQEALAAGVVLRCGTLPAAEAALVATGPPVADGVAREVVFRSSLPDTVIVLFDPEVTPSGYAYLFCLDGHATFGVAQVRGVRGLPAARDRAWARFVAHLGTFSVEDPREGGQFMSFSVPRHLAAAGRWYAGEAAGVQDFLFGLGNRLAFRSAALAAHGLAGEWDGAAFARSVVWPMTAGVAVRWVYEALGRRGFARLCRWLAGGDFQRRLVRLQRPDPARTALARAVMAAWRERDGCRHGPLCTWCRRRER